MPTGNTSLLGLALPVNGELNGTWGTVVNTSITELVDSAVAGTTTLSADADVTLTDTALAANQARQAVILWTASNGATTRNITAPARSKAYIVVNAGTGSVVLRGAGPTTGVTIVSGERCLAAWNGSDFVKISTSTADGVTTFSAGTTGFTPSTATSGAVTLAGTLATTNGGTGLTSFTSGGVVYASSTSALTTGSALTFDGTNFTVSGVGVFGAGTTKLRTYSDTTYSGIFNGASLVAAESIYMGGGTQFFYASGSEQMRLTSTGLGIGTSSPGAKLDVSNTAASTTNIRVNNASASSGAYAQFSTASNAATAYFGASGSGNAVDGGMYDGDFIYLASENNASGLNIGAGIGQAIKFYTNGAASSNLRATIDSSGNLGLGVTPNSGWDTATPAIQVKDRLSLSGFLGNSYVSNNAYLAPSGWRYLTSNPASQFRFADNQFIWNTAPSGTAGDAISFTQAMTLDASGNLLVNTTSSTYSASGRGVIELGGGSTAIFAMKINNSAAGYTYHDGTVFSVNNVLNGALAFATNNTERARITSGGFFGLGTNNPVAMFDLAGDYKEGVVTANTGTAYTINTATGTLQILTLTGNCTFTFPALVSGESFTLLLRQDGTGGRTVTWPAAVRWPGGTAPTITATASQTDKYVFTSDGTRWYGSNAGQAYAA